MKIPRFILGFLAGIAISLSLALFCYNYVFFVRPKNFYQSPILMLYVSEDESGYSQFEILNSREYWEKMSLDAEDVAEDFLAKKGRPEDVSVHCVGSAQAYKVYYAYQRMTSLRLMLDRDETETVILNFIETSYMRDVEKIHSKE